MKNAKNKANAAMSAAILSDALSVGAAMTRVVHVVWLSLLGATLASWWLAEQHGAGAWTVPLVMLIAAGKARAVVLHFMELKAAPLAWRLAFETWVLLATATVCSPSNMTYINSTLAY